jgi:hypothetical protein
MPDHDLPALATRLREQLAAYDWEGADATCTAVVAAIERGETPTAADAKGMIFALRRKRQFAAVARLASALWRRGTQVPQIRRQHAQALIDLGDLAAGESLLQTMLADATTPKEEQMEARGLIGRIHKQTFANAVRRGGTGRAADLDAALSAYESVYSSDPSKLWHGINTVALRMLKGDAKSARAEAERILVVLDERERAMTVPSLPAWDLATRLEAWVALGKSEQAERAAIDYVRCSDADAFEFESTLRQLLEVWQLSDDRDPGRRILPVLRGALLRRPSGVLALPAARALCDHAAGLQLEKRFGNDRSLPIEWYRTGLERCCGIARIEVSGRGQGTGWLVHAKQFFPNRPERETFLLTNAHVVATPEVRASRPAPQPYLAHQVQAHFTCSDKIVGIERVFFCSPVGELDASFLVLKETPTDAVPVPVSFETARREANGTTTRLYIIGHPDGRDLEFSLHDNYLLDSDDKRVHYRTPTEPGSSGSPVFEPLNWHAIALHRAGKEKMGRLSAPGETHQANEGIYLSAIRRAIAQ